METISILGTPNTGENGWQPVNGDITMAMLNSNNFANIDKAGREKLLSEAVEILSHCYKPGQVGNITNLAVGYVQSGKTSSFTILSALAVDNGFAAVICIAGTKNNLLAQTTTRLKRAFQGLDTDDHNVVVCDEARFEQDPSHYLERPDYTVILPILKKSDHIKRLTNVFADSGVAGLLQNRSVLIIDDEADQASLNTKASTNRRREWDETEFSSTYSSINNLRNALPCHSYVQYTATPQAPLLISEHDLLSPTYYTILTPGSGYTGGKFFLDNSDGYTVVIPEEELYNRRLGRTLSDIPKSLEDALMRFFVSVAIVVEIQHRVRFLSMMVHIDGIRETNEKFTEWVNSWVNRWRTSVRTTPNDIGYEVFRGIVRSAYDDMVSKMSDYPPFDDVWHKLDKVLMRCDVHLVQPQGDVQIDWNDSPAHVLVGADMLNRGFTVENLSTSYLQRCGKATNNADTLEQRARFFGYKEKYSDVVRIYMSQKLISLFGDYVEHEEEFRNAMINCRSRKVKDLARAFCLSNTTLRPTRTNILSNKLFRLRMSGWHQLATSTLSQSNRNLVESFCSSIANWQIHEACVASSRQNLFASVSVKQFCDFWQDFEYAEVPHKMRKVCTLRSLKYLEGKGELSNVWIVKMSNLAPRERSLDSHGKPKNMQEGHGSNYDGDKSVMFEDSITVQIHNVKLKKPGSNENGKCVYNIAIYYPDSFVRSYVALGEDIDDDEDYDD